MTTGVPTKERKKKGRPRGRKEYRSIQARLPPLMAEALDALAERNHRTRNQQMIVAIEKDLFDAGMWPPGIELPAK